MRSILHFLVWKLVWYCIDGSVRQSFVHHCERGRIKISSLKTRKRAPIFCLFHSINNAHRPITLSTDTNAPREQQKVFVMFLYYSSIVWSATAVYGMAVFSFQGRLQCERFVIEWNDWHELYTGHKELRNDQNSLRHQDE